MVMLTPDCINPRAPRTKESQLDRGLKSAFRILFRSVILWMDELLHHFETMGEAIVCWYLRWGIESFQVRFMDFATIHGTNYGVTTGLPLGALP